MKRKIYSIATLLVLFALVISPFFGPPVEAKKKGPGYTSPPRCCTEPECKLGPGWNAPLPKGIVKIGPVAQPRPGW